MNVRRLSSREPEFLSTLDALLHFDHGTDEAIERTVAEILANVRNLGDAAVRRGARLRVATKYIQTAREHFAAKGVHVDLIKLYGSMELAPLVGLSDAIVDLVSSGNTLKANNLRAVEEVAQISSRLVVNQAALKLKRDAIQPMLDAFAGAVNK